MEILKKDGDLKTRWRLKTINRDLKTRWRFKNKTEI